MKTFLKVLGGIAFLALLAGGVVFYATGNLVKVADAFFAAIKARDYKTAASHLSEEFRAATPVADFAELMDRSALRKFRTVSWSNRSVSPGRGDLEGIVTTDSGGSIPLKLSLVKENGAWRIYAIGKVAAGMTGSHGADLPGPKDAFPLVRTTMAKIAQAVATRDMSPVSGPPTTESTQALYKSVQEGLQPFIDNHIDLSPLTKLDPELYAPVLDDRGYLVMTGYYEADEMTRLKFKFSYAETLLAWKLANFELNLLKAK